MTKDQLNTLLDKYYEAQTIREEEEMLTDYLQAHEVEGDQKADQYLLRAMSRQQVDVPADLEHRLSKQIDGWNSIERSGIRRARAINLKWITGMAASVVLLLSFSTFLNTHHHSAKPMADIQETYDNPDDAAGETARALTKFSLALNKGLHQINNSSTKN